MAKVRLVVGDQSSAEFDQARRAVNSLLLFLENVAGTTFTTLADMQEVIANTLSTGVDSSLTTAASADDYVGTGVEVAGLRTMNRHPARPGAKAGTQLRDASVEDAE